MPAATAIVGFSMALRLSRRAGSFLVPSPRALAHNRPQAEDPLLLSPLLSSVLLLSSLVFLSPISFSNSTCFSIMMSFHGFPA